jgi:hypothetical protein
VRARELIEPRTKDRKFPVGLFCPIALDLHFTANASSATIRFSTNVFWNDGNSLRWTEQYLDNICVADSAVFVNTQVAPGSYSSSCYVGVGELIPARFAFQSAGTIPLKELFASNPSGTWDLSHGAYWRSNYSAPSNPGVENDTTSSGSLGMGQDSATPSASDSAITSITVRVSARTGYDLSGWWDARRVLELNTVFLTVHITGPGATPIVTKTWGALKRQYR